jgi:tetrahydromethanopterin S-methyltransferase subunit A
MTESQTPLIRIESSLREAMAANKCRRCGCFHDTINALQDSSTIAGALGGMLTEAHHLFQTKRYDCLGCEVCWPAVVQNLAAELDPVLAEGSHCATQAPEVREGWPPLPGDYRVVRFQAPVAVCTLNADHMAKALAMGQQEGLSIVGSLHTENLGIEHLICNTLANPHIRFLIVCGEDTRKAIGHLPGQSLLALSEYGIDDKMRIINAKGKRPFVKNITPEHVEAFRNQVQVIDQIGNDDISALLELVAATAVNDPGPFANAPTDVNPIPIEVAIEPGKLVLDPAGYFVVYPDRAHQRLTLEHYTNKGVLNRIFTAASATAIYTRVIEAKLISRLDHAAYLGRELARAEQALESGEDYIQDRAAGELEQMTSADTEKKESPCGCQAGKGESCC